MRLRVRTSALVRSASREAIGLGTSAVLAVLLLSSTLQAQTRGAVTGTITNAQTGGPVQGVMIQAIGTQQGTLSRPDGTFRLELAAGQHEIRVALLGFAPVTETVAVPAGGVVNRNFQLTPSAVALDEIVAVGTRRADRTVTASPVPVDVITAAVIENTGLTETAQIIQRLAPSVNFPRTSISDGTDHMRPVTLRGLAPDQVLVLINGKRRHTTSLVHVNGTVGRGSTSVDLNAIPASAIERIEVLRDGAAAQYGSDAIAGVVNIVLKSGTQQNLTATLGQTATNENGRTHRDGEVIQLGGSYGLGIGQGGFVTLSAEFRDRNRTNRAYPDARQQYFPAGNPQNTEPPRISSWQGDGDARDVGGFLNAAFPLENGMEVYTFGGATYREGQAAGFFRRPLDDRTVRAIHPNGFLPEIGSQIQDFSGAGGLRGVMAGWRWDASTLLGGNSFRFDVLNSNNTSMGTASPTEFYAGTLRFNQWTNNIDFAREVALGFGSPVNVAFGAEFRRDNYQIEAGEAASYQDGGQRILDGPAAGELTALGSQVFPGFRPADAKSESRNNTAAYVDLESQVTGMLLLTVAGRVENYSDFGSTADGKVAGRLQLIPQLAVRGAAGTGFRAPALAQSFFSSTATNFIGGVPFDIRTFPVASLEAQVLGAQPLKPEESVNLSAGLALEPVAGLTATVDFYRILIDDRIVLSGNFVGPEVRALFQARGLGGVGGGRFFTNAIDTRTDGFDVVANYGILLGDVGLLRVTGGYNQTRTEVRRVSATPPELSAFQETLFDRVERGRIEQGQPRNNVNLTLNHTLNNFAVNLHNQRFGEVSQLQANPAQDQTFSARWISDLDVSYRLPQQRLRVALGANNLFDVYPDAWMDFDVAGPLSTSGIYRYPGGVSPFGFNGRFVYLRLAYGM
jgi:iron complex outermembrane recepter protein